MSGFYMAEFRVCVYKQLAYRTHSDLSHMVVHSHVRLCILSMLCIQLRIKKTILKVAL